jgi:hypothetical protein
VIEDVPTLMPPTPDEREADHIAASKFGQTAVEASWVPRHVRGMGEALCRAPLAVLDGRGGRSGHQLPCRPSPLVATMHPVGVAGFDLRGAAGAVIGGDGPQGPKACVDRCSANSSASSRGA